MRETGHRKLNRRTVLAASLQALPVLALSAAREDPAAGNLVRVIVPYTAGSIGDIFVRQLADALQHRMGKVFLVDNRPGGSQSIGAVAAAHAAPDGSTVFLGTQSGLVLEILARKKAPFDSLHDFAPISMLFRTPMFLYVRASLKAKNVAELIALAKASPGKMTFASIGRGTSSHLAGEMFKSAVSVDMLHVPYRGGPAATNALVSGEVDMMFNGGNVFPMLKQGRVRALGVASKQRFAYLPDLPTMDEAGVRGFLVLPWFALFAPSGTPESAIEHMNSEVTAVLSQPAFREHVLAQGLEVQPSSPRELGTILAGDFKIWEPVMRRSGIDAE
jgi:tripartite-type tricarboxylate transporter receptor subunit TctC